eukprot:scaffold16829_cov69-Phaeocystis_antarctica.AAC.6
MTKPSVANKVAEANHPVAVPPQWLPVLLASASPSPKPSSPPAPPCISRGDWPPLMRLRNETQCEDVATTWEAHQKCHESARENTIVGSIYVKCHALYEDNPCYPPGDDKTRPPPAKKGFGCIRDA